jgi:hypothetical protein
MHKDHYEVKKSVTRLTCRALLQVAITETPTK